MPSTLLTALLIVIAGPLLVSWVYLGVLSLAALRGRAASRIAERHLPMLAVLVPAHNEAELISRCVGSLLAQSLAAQQVVVIADNCDDETAARARAAGARVLVRTEPASPGKGRALRWAMDALLQEPDSPDGFVIVDADSVADAGLIEGLAVALAEGAAVAQSDYTVLPDDAAGAGDSLRALAVLLFNRTRNRGRAVLGLPASLLGNGMALSRQHVLAHPWNAFSAVEDLEYGTECRLHGVHPRFVWNQGVRGPIPLGYQASVGQRMRWEGGRFHVLRQYGPHLALRLAARPSTAALDGLFDLAIPPLWILVLLTAAGAIASVPIAFQSRMGGAAAALWAACLALALVHVGVGLKAGGAPRGSYRVLLALPGFLAWKVAVYARMVRGFDPNRWQRSVRPGEAR